MGAGSYGVDVSQDLACKAQKWDFSMFVTTCLDPFVLVKMDDVGMFKVSVNRF